MVLGGDICGIFLDRRLFFLEATIGRRRVVNVKGEDVGRAREELMELEAARLRLSEEVMKGNSEALEEDRRLEQRIRELGNQLASPGQEEEGER